MEFFNTNKKKNREKLNKKWRVENKAANRRTRTINSVEIRRGWDRCLQIKRLPCNHGHQQANRKMRFLRRGMFSQIFSSHANKPEHVCTQLPLHSASQTQHRAPAITTDYQILIMLADTECRRVTIMVCIKRACTGPKQLPFGLW